MAQATQTYKRSLSGSVGAGLSSVFGGGGRTYYILEHKVSSKYHKAGEAQEIIVDQIELGRDSKCQVQFDESFKTVSRRHAAIVRDGENWKLIQLSQTNTTFLNGRPIQNEWYLQNGDEIQLSVNGPKLGFIIPSGNKATTGSIGLSRRLSLFRQQALKPYKTAMAVMGTVIVLLLGGGITYGVIDYKHDVERAELNQQQIDAANARAEAAIAESNQRQEAMEQEMKRMKKEYATLQKQLKEATAPSVGSRDESDPHVSGSATSNKTIAACEPYVYFVLIRKIVISYDGETKTFENIGSGSGFMLDDGRFVTARHVVEPWMYPTSENDEFNLLCNAVAHNGGTVTSYIEAYSPSGEQIKFTSKQVVVNRSSDKHLSLEGVTIAIPENGALDWAYFRSGKNKGLTYNNGLSRSLPIQAKLTILGYPLGMGMDDLRPMYSQAIVAREGLYHDMIVTTSDGTEHGNSGGPVFATSTNGDLIVVGLVSAGRGEHSGVFVPICSVQ